jgi:hypothetical protein
MAAGDRAGDDEALDLAGALAQLPGSSGLIRSGFLGGRFVSFGRVQRL